MPIQDCAPPAESATAVRDRRPEPGAAASPPVIRVQGLSKVYRTYKKQPGLLGAIKGLVRREYQLTAAAQGIDFDVAPGEMVGFLGPNGAGKTTTLKMLAGLLHPTSGSATVLGFTPWERRVEYRRQFALLLGQKNQLWWDLPARDSLELNARIYGIERKNFERTLDELAEMLRVREKLQIMVRELSLGERMKMELIASLLHQPKVLFLDEPTIGLDVVSQNVVREFLKEYNQLRKTTILLTSHYMADIEALCRRVIMIARGRILFDGPLSDVIENWAPFKLVDLHAGGRQDLSRLSWDRFGEPVEASAHRVRLRVQRDRVIPVCKELLELRGITDIGIHDVPIDWIVRNLFMRQAEASNPSAAR